MGIAKKTVTSPATTISTAGEFQSAFIGLVDKFTPSAAQAKSFGNLCSAVERFASAESRALKAADRKADQIAKCKERLAKLEGNG